MSITQKPLNKPLRQTIKLIFQKAIEMVQYNAAFTLTGAIKGTCHDKII